MVERLFIRAVERGRLPSELEASRHIADANGGFSLSDADPSVAELLRVGLLAEARAEMELPVVTPLVGDDATYRASLEKLVAVLSKG